MSKVQTAGLIVKEEALKDIYKYGSRCGHDLKSIFGITSDLKTICEECSYSYERDAKLTFDVSNRRVTSFYEGPLRISENFGTDCDAVDCIYENG